MNIARTKASATGPFPLQPRDRRRNLKPTLLRRSVAFVAKHFWEDCFGITIAPRCEMSPTHAVHSCLRHRITSSPAGGAARVRHPPKYSLATITNRSRPRPRTVRQPLDILGQSSWTREGTPTNTAFGSGAGRVVSEEVRSRRFDRCWLGSPPGASAKPSTSAKPTLRRAWSSRNADDRPLLEMLYNGVEDSFRQRHRTGCGAEQTPWRTFC